MPFSTGSFAAGFYMVAMADIITLGLILVLYRITRGDRNSERVSRKGAIAEGTT